MIYLVLSDYPSLGMKSGNITDQQITSSSYSPDSSITNARPDSAGSGYWCSASNDSDPWLQLDLKTLHYIVGVSLRLQIFNDTETPPRQFLNCTVVNKTVSVTSPSPTESLSTTIANAIHNGSIVPSADWLLNSTNSTGSVTASAGNWWLNTTALNATHGYTATPFGGLIHNSTSFSISSLLNTSSAFNASEFTARLEATQTPGIATKVISETICENVTVGRRFERQMPERNVPIELEYGLNESTLVSWTEVRKNNCMFVVNQIHLPRK